MTRKKSHYQLSADEGLISHEEARGLEMAEMASRHGGAGRGQGRRALYDAPLDAQIQARVTAGQRAAYDRLGGADWLRAQLDVKTNRIEKGAKES